MIWTVALYRSLCLQCPNSSNNHFSTPMLPSSEAELQAGPIAAQGSKVSGVISGLFSGLELSSRDSLVRLQQG